MATISINNVTRAIYEATQDKHSVELDSVLKNATELIAKSHLMGKSGDILAELQKIIDDDTGVVRATVTSGNPLSKKHQDDIESEIKKRYRAKEVALTLVEDTKLLDGIKIEIGDEIIDLSLKNKIHQLQEYLLKN
jgi:F-type H+-transporting ATPase subunit delta